MVTFGKRGACWLGAAAAVLAAAGCTHPPAAASGTGPPAASRAGPAAAAVTRPFPATFIGVAQSGLNIGALAVYSSLNGHLLKFLTAGPPGGGTADPELSADGRTVVFVRGTGTCADTIDTVPASGGAERVLIPLTGRLPTDVIPYAASYSADGRYLIYATVPCSPPRTILIHVRNLRTGRELTGPGPSGLVDHVFVNDDRQVVSVGSPGLAVLQLPSLRARAYPAPRGCQYQGLAGTETELVGMLQCGARHALSIVSVSPRTFAVTGTLVRLGSCLFGDSISAAFGDPSAILAETVNTACQPPPQLPTFRIVKVRGHQVSLVLSGGPAMPYQPVW